MSLLGYKQRVKNSMDYMAYLPREIHPNENQALVTANNARHAGGLFQTVTQYLRTEFNNLLGSTRQAYLTERK
ncbi:hypothetical protein AC626_12415 [Pseudoalteromonas rubra]|uniref:Uncharacterized protein n=1 Tax=Pseudoalteromonas rubra TaxID=43658 RepID=A0A0L0ERY6_9GAMM|nr:hypothetical protein AC626_12415 [Pseudoalteromonas rubra]